MMDIDDTSNPKPNLSIKTDIELLKTKLLLFSKKPHIEDPFTRTPDNSYTNESTEFTKDLAPSYNQFYLNQISRASKMREKLYNNAKIKWPNTLICEKIREVQEKKAQIIIGSFYKDMKKKPNILKGLESVLGAKKIKDFVNENDDFLIIEDNSGRIKISDIKIKGINNAQICSGVFAAIK